MQEALHRPTVCSPHQCTDWRGCCLLQDSWALPYLCLNISSPPLKEYSSEGSHFHMLTSIHTYLALAGSQGGTGVPEWDSYKSWVFLPACQPICCEPLPSPTSVERPRKCQASSSVASPWPSLRLSVSEASMCFLFPQLLEEGLSLPHKSPPVQRHRFPAIQGSMCGITATKGCLNLTQWL